MTGAVSTPRYSAEDFETASIRSIAPSYTSDAPSYHSRVSHGESIPAYSPRIRNITAERTNLGVRNQTSSQRQRTIGLPPIPPAPLSSLPTLHNFRLPTWSTANASAARQYRNVAERRITDGRYQLGDATVKRAGASTDRVDVQAVEDNVIRPLEDPYLVGEEAASEARRERLARESGEDILQREDKRWDWLLIQMKDWDERERNWNKFRRDHESKQSRTFLRRVGGGLLSMT